MKLFHRVADDVKAYFPYTKYSAKSDLKAEVASSYLNWLWWILDPMLFMMVYTFIAIVVFRSGKPYFPVFVFVGLTLWTFFNKTVLSSVKIIRSNSHIISKVYLPKYFLIFQNMMVNGFKMLISFLLIIVMMVLYRVPVTFNVIYIIPIMVDLVLITFGVSCFMLHFGVFVDDLHNVMQVLLRLMFYLTGIFFSISDKVPEPYLTILLKCNPAAMLIESARMCLLYSQTPYRKLIVLWGCVGVVLCITGTRTIYKYENGYVKVM
ncbi:MAG: ABC transporter permease [Blautia sp.]|nr:ABC transporter permease [Blautia sp.]